MQSQYDDSAAELEAERKRREKAEAQVQDLQMDVKDAWGQLEDKVADVYTSQQEIQKLKDEMESVKKQYYLVSDRVEEEQSRLMEAQKMTVQLSEQVPHLTDLSRQNEC